MIQEVKEKHHISKHMDTSEILNTSVDTCFANKIVLN